MTQLASPQGVGFDPKQGGRIATTDSGLTRSPDQTTFTPTGVAFGPLEFATPPDDIVLVDRLEFLPELSGDDSALLGLAVGGAATGAAGSDEESPVSRRDIIRASGALLAGAALVGTAVADTQEYPIAEFDLTRNDSAMQLSVFDPVTDLLPGNETLHLDCEGTRLGSFDTLETTNPESTTVTTGREGTFRVYTPDSVPRRDRLLAWVNGLIDRDNELVFEFELEQDASAYEEGTMLELADHPAVVEPDIEIDGDETILEIGGESIAHEDQRFGHDRGVYRLADGVLVYEVGENAPESSSVAVQVRVSTVANTLDSIRR